MRAYFVETILLIYRAQGAYKTIPDELELRLKDPSEDERYKECEEERDGVKKKGDIEGEHVGTERVIDSIRELLGLAYMGYAGL
jgi:hypothetical protein